MDELRVEAHLPMDEGFLRRECPHCERQFKWLHRDSPSQAPDRYFCPYCRRPAPPASWWTQDQVTYLRALAVSSYVTPILDDFKHTVESSNRAGTRHHIEAQITPPPRPAPLSEPHDMERMDFTCHPHEPIKVQVKWKRKVGCIICAVRRAD